MDCTFKQGRIWKGSDSELELFLFPNMYIGKAENVIVKVFTEPEPVFEFKGEDLTIVDNIGTVHLQAVQVEAMADGLVHYIVDYDIEDSHVTKELETKYYVKTPVPYTPIDYVTTDTVDSVVSKAFEALSGASVGYVTEKVEDAVTEAKNYTDDKVSEGVEEAVNVSKTYTDTQLEDYYKKAEVDDYVNKAVVVGVNASKEYTDEKLGDYWNGNTVNNAINQMGNQAVATGKKYTDDALKEYMKSGFVIDEIDKAIKGIKDYTDTEFTHYLTAPETKELVTSGVTDSKKYTDSKVNDGVKEAISTSKEYTDSKLENIYTKTEVDDSVNNGVATAVQESKEYIDEKLTEYWNGNTVQNAIVQIGAYAITTSKKYTDDSLKEYMKSGFIMDEIDKAVKGLKEYTDGEFEHYFTAPETSELVSACETESKRYTDERLKNYWNATIVDNKLKELEKKIGGAGASVEYVDESIAAEVQRCEDTYLKKGEVPEGLATEQWVNNQGFLKEHQDISGKADKTYVDGEIQKVEGKIPSLNGYAKEQWVKDQGYLTEHQKLKTINGESVIGTGDIVIKASGVVDSAMSDTSENAVQNKVIKAYVDGKVPSLDGYATQQWVNNQGFLKQHQDISGKADKTYVDSEIQKVEAKIPSLDGYATEQWVNNQGFLKQHQDISGKADKTYVDGEIQKVESKIPSVDSTMSDTSTNAIQNKTVKAYIDEQVGDIERILRTL